MATVTGLSRPAERTDLAGPARVDPQIDRIVHSPQFQQLIAERTRFGWILTILMLVVYFGFIGLIAFDKELLAGIYVVRANTRFDALSETLRREFGR